MRILHAIVDTILPPRCIITGDAVDSQGTISPKAWADLSFITAPFCTCCGFPFEFDTGFENAENLCAACLKERPVFSKARSALIYNDASRDLILGFKHGDKMHAVVTMTPWLKLAGADLWAEADLVVPVPLNRWRLMRRRFNQSAIMAQETAKAIRKDVIVDALLRTRATPSQGHLKAGERAENVKNAFTVNPKRAGEVTGKNIILIDDVYTTGSTVSECAKALLKGGAASVNVLSLARVVRPEKF